MAEAFGLAASAAGFVSLGLQVYSGVKTYIDGVKDRKAELNQVSRLADAFHITVNTLQNRMPAINAELSNGDTPLVPALKLVEEELWALKLFLNSLKPAEGQGFSIATTLKEQKKRFTFPFHQKTLESLQKKLESATMALQASLQVVGIMVTTSISTTVSEVHTTVNDSQSVLMDTQSGVQSLQASMSSLALSLAPTQASVGSIDRRLESLTTTNETLARDFQSVNSHIGHMSEDMRNALSTIQIMAATIYGAVRLNNQEIHQLHNLLVQSSSRQSTTAEDGKQKLNDLMACFLNNKSDTPANVNQQQLLMGRLMSKPGDLKDACNADEVIMKQTDAQPRVPLSEDHHCKCHSRTTKQSTKSFGYFYSIKKVTTEHQHLPGCYFGAFDRITTTYVRGITYTGLQWLLARSLELSMSWTTGAGGSSISPSITVRPVVDENKSPVFRVINIVSSNLEFAIKALDPNTRNYHIIEVLEHSVEAILEIYRGNKCSFYDVNQNGESALSKWLTLLIEVNKLIPKLGTKNAFSTFQSAAASSVRYLTPIGSRGSLSDYNGISPVNKTLDAPAWNFRLAELAETFEVLCVYDNNLLWHTQWGIHYGASDVILDFNSLKTIFEKSQTMSKVFEVGPLSEAVVLEDTDRMRSLIERDVNSLKEKNYASQTPFHLAAELYNPEIIRILVEASQDRTAQFDIPERRGRYALDIAAKQSGSACRNKCAWELCTNCPCSVPFDLLSKSGWQLSPAQAFFPCRLLFRASHAIRPDLILALRRTREELQTTARLHLSAYHRRCFQLDTRQIIDANAYDVVKKLIESGVELPRGYKDLFQSQRITSGNTIYHDLCTNSRRSDGSDHLLEIFHHIGFTDFDHENGAGETPLELLIDFNSIAIHPALFLWFLQRGANVSRTRSKLALRILNFGTWNKLSRSHVPTIADIIQLIAPLSCHDECSCGCVETACTTTTILFQSLWKEFFVHRRRSLFEAYDWRAVDTTTSFLQSIFICEQEDKSSATDKPLCSNDKEGTDMEETSSAAVMTDKETRRRDSENKGYPTILRKCTQHLSEFLQEVQIDFAKWGHCCASALRFFTFEALGFRHTCRCRIATTWNPPPKDEEFEFSRWDSTPRVYSEEDIKEMQDEDSDLLGLLNDLVKELVEEFESSGDTFERFLTRSWVGRVEITLKSLGKAEMTPDQVRAAEEVGISWDRPSPPAEQADSTRGEMRPPADEAHFTGVETIPSMEDVNSTSGETSSSAEDVESALCGSNSPEWDVGVDSSSMGAAEESEHFLKGSSVTESKNWRSSSPKLSHDTLLDKMLSQIDEIVGESYAD